jgi:predicted transcriptional regulator
MDDVSVAIELTVEIVAHYVAHNHVDVDQLPTLINRINAALRGLHEPQPKAQATSVKATAAQIRKSIKPDGLISFLDGKSYKTLKRHLTKHGLTFLDYKERFGLPPDYPSTAVNFAARRSALALSSGLGRANRTHEPPTSPPIAAANVKRAKKART